MVHRGNLLLGHFWSYHESLNLESIEEKFDTVCLDYIVDINEELSLNYAKLLERK